MLGDEIIFAHPEQNPARVSEMKVEAALVTHNSPYAEVRGVASNKDDPSLPQLTFRVWVLGLFFTVLRAFVNQLFSVRSPPIGIPIIVTQVLSYPCGRAMARWLPDWSFDVLGHRFSLNPGPFNYKEHMLIVIMAGCSDKPYTQYIIWIQVLPQFFNQPWARSLAYQFAVGFSTQFMGYGLAGFCRTFFVYPSYAIWPSNMGVLALNRAFHEETNMPVQGPHGKWIAVTRLKYFLVAGTAMAIYHWLPSFLFQALSVFSWVEFLFPKSIAVKALFGSWYGLGLNPIPTFDWNNISSEDTMQPLVRFS